MINKQIAFLMAEGLTEQQAIATLSLDPITELGRIWETLYLIQLHLLSKKEINVS